ncbi:C-C motif chemokine 2 [Anabarilius grahami]|uniref:C-C motif chemokine 2 n=1 Tax=Anabarilius grahami TaxID=495550 RepID=A0A3N0Z8A0_ANAGA|nr:C-C motif chemokine 2 [Anabarilius grahami]
MRSLMFLLVLVIFCSLQMTSSATIAVDAANSNCCMEFYDKKIPVRQVKSYSWTSSNCPRRAVVFHTIKKNKICVEPETPWVNSHIAIVDKRTRV